MERLTRKDWAIINEALGYYEATDTQGEFGLTNDEAAEQDAALEQARRKVWQRLPDA